MTGPVVVLGVDVDAQSRCAHYHGPHDILALKFPCCGQFYSCRECHDERADHPAGLWDEADRGEHALWCGACQTTFSIQTYLSGDSSCPHCGAAFNPGCRGHRHLYFAF